MTRLRLVFAGSVGALLLGAAAVRAQDAHTEAGLHIFKTANCIGCHHWDGSAAGGGYGGAAANLRTTELTPEQIAQVVTCGRPGTGMPHFARDAYTTARCYGMSAGQMPADQMPPEPGRYLQPEEIATVVNYVVANIKGRGAPTFAECQAVFGTETRACDTLAPTGASHHPHVEAAPDANKGTN